MDTIMQQLYRPRAYTARVAPGVVRVASYVRISFDRAGKRHGVSDQRQDVVALIEGIPGLEVAKDDLDDPDAGVSLVLEPKGDLPALAYLYWQLFTRVSQYEAPNFDPLRYMGYEMNVKVTAESSGHGDA